MLYIELIPNSRWSMKISGNLINSVCFIRAWCILSGFTKFTIDLDVKFIVHCVNIFANNKVFAVRETYRDKLVYQGII